LIGWFHSKNLDGAAVASRLESLPGTPG